MPNYEFDILIHGKSTTKYRHEGRYYVEGRPGSEFTLLVRNNTASRILAVMTVDGLSIMDGKAGSKEGTGYVVSPFQTLKIPGWRLNDDDVAKFVFAGKGKSYAAKKGKSQNVGVIGCAIFEEDRPSYCFYPSVTWTTLNTGPLRSCDHTGTPSPWSGTTTTGEAPHTYTITSTDAITECCDSNVISCNSVDVAASSAGKPVRSRSAHRVSTKKMATQNIGTGFGQKASHEVTEVSFNRKDRPSEVFAIHYDDRAGLEARGIDLSRKVHIANPFPKDEEKGCEPPADWNG